MKKLKKVPLVERYFHVFKVADGSKVEVETTGVDYKQLAKKNPINPTHPNGKWYGSYSGYKIGLNEWADENGIQKLVNIDGSTLPISNEFVIDNNITDDGEVEFVRIKTSQQQWQ
jgi:hypothetical protein